MKFEELRVWQRSVELSVEIYRVFRGHHDYGFRDQITRSSLSVSSNIAEGYERASRPDRMRFLNYAKGSAGELRSQIYIGMRIGYIDPETGKRWRREAEEISRMLYSLIRHHGKRSG